MDSSVSRLELGSAPSGEARLRLIAEKRLADLGIIENQMDGHEDEVDPSVRPPLQGVTCGSRPRA